MITIVNVRPKNTSSISKMQKMVKTTKVKVLNDPKSSDVTTTKSFPDQDDKTRRLVKLLLIISLGQAIVVITAGSLFGVLLAAKVRICLFLLHRRIFTYVSFVTVTGAWVL